MSHHAVYLHLLIISVVEHLLCLQFISTSSLEECLFELFACFYPFA
jgi:hypothetical protein